MALKKFLLSNGIGSEEKEILKPFVTAKDHKSFDKFRVTSSQRNGCISASQRFSQNTYYTSKVCDYSFMLTYWVFLETFT